MFSILKAVAKIMGGLVIVGLGFFLWIKYEQSKYDSTAVPFVNKIVVDMSSWDPNSIKPLLAPALAKAISDVDLERVFNLYKKLGGLSKINDISFQGVHVGYDDHMVSSKELTYNIKTEYSSGEATITLKLLVTDTGFQILGFNITSNALL